MENIRELIKIARRKLEIDKNKNENERWSEGSETYFEEMQKEIQEAQEENKEKNHIKLEDELGDILWDYANLLVNLEHEQKINLNNVFQRAVKKYEERIKGIENNVPWSEIKKKQKEEIKKEINDDISNVQIRENQKKRTLFLATNRTTNKTKNSRDKKRKLRKNIRNTKRRTCNCDDIVL